MLKSPLLNSFIHTQNAHAKARGKYKMKFIRVSEQTIKEIGDFF